MIFSRISSSLTKLSVVIGSAAVFLMTLIAALGVFARLIGYPMIGNVELVEIMLLTLIMFTLSYAQSQDRHIAIGIIADRFPQPVQTFIDMFSYAATAAYGFVVGYVFLLDSYENFTVAKETTVILEVPLYILKLIVGVGFIIWGLEALNRIYKRAKGLSQPKHHHERGHGE